MTSPADNLAQQVVDGWPGTVILHGPVCSGKTAAALTLYRRFVDASGRPRCLLIGPNATAVNDLRRQLLRTSPTGVLLGPQVLTFSALAGQILSGGSLATRMISPFARHVLLRHIVDEINEQGQLPTLRRIARTPGLIETLDRSIAELKRAAVEPEDLAKAIALRPSQGAPAAGESFAHGKSADLLEIYRRYQQHLQAQGLYDVEGQIWAARDELRRLGGQTLPACLAGLEAMVIDGFTDFTPTQLEMLALLAGRVGRLVITLPFATDRRQRMWKWTGRSLERIRAAFQPPPREIALAAPAGLPLGSLWQSVFDFEAQRFAPPPQLQVIAAAGANAEIAAVARRVKRLLMEGAPAGSIGVLARSMQPCQETIQRVFAEHDIPIRWGPVGLVEVPLVRFLLDAAAIAPDFKFRAVLGVIKNSYFHPQRLGDFDEMTVAVAEMVIREGNVLAGRESYADAAQRLIQRAQRATRRACDQAAGDSDGDEDVPAFRLGPLHIQSHDIERAAALLERLFDLAAAAGDPAGLSALAEALGLRQAALGHGQAKLIARDLRGLAAMEQALLELPTPPPPMDAIREALAAVSVSPDRTESLVDVLDVLDARAVRYDHVFLLGVGDGQFPHRIAEGSLITEADRQAWSGRNIMLDRRGDLMAREMLLFYLAVSRATHLTISYLATDGSGKPAAPSHFLLSLLDGCGGLAGIKAAGGFHEILAGEFVPPVNEIASPRDAFNAAVAGLFDPQYDPDARALAWAASADRDRLAPAAAGLLARHRRWRRGTCDEFDGRIDELGLLQTLREQFPAKTVFSASQLNAYGQCPWQFFASYVLKLRPLAEPQRMLEAVSAGVFCHDVLFRVMTALRADQPSLRLDEVDEARLLTALDQAVAAESASVDSRQPPYPILWEIQRNQLHEALAGYLLSQRGQVDLHAGGLHFELAFGMSKHNQELQDASSSDDPVTIETPAGPIQLRGRIDRIDRIEFDGQTGLLIVDYKTGRLPSEKDLTEGRNLQLPLYAAAAARILSQESVGGVFHQVSAEGGMRFFAIVRKRGQKFIACDDYPERLDAAMAKVGEFIAGMARGRFDLLPTGRCPSYCEFRQICHFAPARLEFKMPTSGAGAIAPEGTP